MKSRRLCLGLPDFSHQNATIGIEMVRELLHREPRVSCHDAGFFTNNVLFYRLSAISGNLNQVCPLNARLAKTVKPHSQERGVDVDFEALNSRQKID